MTCECMKNSGLLESGDAPLHHHPVCEKYSVEKFPYLFYFDEGVGSWIPATEEVPGIIEVSNLDPGDYVEIEFKRVDLTDAEFHSLPDI